MMRSFVIFFALILCCKIAASQRQTFLEDFSPDNPNYESLLDNYQFDSLYWTEWQPTYPSGSVLMHYKCLFYRQSNGNLHQIQQYYQNANSWKQSYRYTYYYDENNRMNSYWQEWEYPAGNWFYYNIYDFSYDDQNRVTTKHITTFTGHGYPDGHSEYQYQYDEEGHLINKTYQDGDYPFNRWLYSYKDGKIDSVCYQRFGLYHPGCWNNVDLYLYTYEDDNIANILHQKRKYPDEFWYNFENTHYEYNPSESSIIIVNQSIDSTGWVNNTRMIRTHNEYGMPLQELCQLWQNEEWIDKQKCDYSIDENGNCTDAKWKEYANGSWIDSHNNYELSIYYNKGASFLSGSVQGYHTSYVNVNMLSTDESNVKEVAKAFPNPGISQLNIKADIPLDRIEIYDVWGRLIINNTISGNEIQINTERWPKGLYFWKVYSSSSTLCGKWVKNNF